MLEHTSSDRKDYYYNINPAKIPSEVLLNLERSTRWVGSLGVLSVVGPPPNLTCEAIHALLASSQTTNRLLDSSSAPSLQRGSGCCQVVLFYRYYFISLSTSPCQAGLAHSLSRVFL